MGCYYQLVADFENARRYFSKATSLNHRFAPAWVGFGHAFAAQDESDQAMAAYRTASRLFPRLARAVARHRDGVPPHQPHRPRAPVHQRSRAAAPRRAFGAPRARRPPLPQGRVQQRRALLPPGRRGLAPPRRRRARAVGLQPRPRVPQAARLRLRRQVVPRRARSTRGSPPPTRRSASRSTSAATSTPRSSSTTRRSPSSPTTPSPARCSPRP